MLKFIYLTLSWRRPSSYRNQFIDLFLRKGALKICSKCTEEHPWRSCKANLLKSRFGMGVQMFKWNWNEMKIHWNEKTLYRSIHRKVFFNLCLASIIKIILKCLRSSQIFKVVQVNAFLSTFQGVWSQL